MAIKTENLYRKLYDNLRSMGYNVVPVDAMTAKDTVPEEADFLQFDFDQAAEISPVTLVVEKINDRYALVVYFNDDATDEESGEWSQLIPKIRSISQRCGIHGFVLKNINNFKPDMAKRQYMKKQEQISEGYYPMGKSASYNDAIPTVKIILQHTRQIQEGEQRYRNVAKIFLENTQGERILAPTNKPGIAQIYARHLAEGGVPNDERWNHIKSLCEEYSKMAGFVRAVRGNQFNESAQKLVDAGLNHYQSLRESLGKMRGHRGYNMYFESWTPALMETEGDESNLNELFVQETLDPRIESVMPILSKLSKNLGEMKQVKELEEWADNLTETSTEEAVHKAASAPPEEEEQDLDEDADAEAAAKKSKVPAFMRKASGKEDWKTTTGDLEKAKERHISGKEGLAALQKRTDENEEGVEEGIGDAVKHGVKKLKRGMQGWGAFDKDTPKELVKRNQAYDDDTVKLLSKTGKTTPHSPADLQKRVLDREMKKRGLGEGVGEDLVYVSVDRAEAFEDWMDSEGLSTNVPKEDHGTYVIYDFSDADHTAKMYADQWNEKRSQLDELSPETLKSYHKKAVDQLTKGNVPLKKFDKRETGAIKAFKKAYDQKDMMEGLDPEKRARLNDLIDQYRNATDPEQDYYSGDDIYDEDEVIELIRAEFGDKIASEVQAGADKMHYPRHGIQGYDPLSWKQPANRITKAGKMYKQDSDYRKNMIKSRYKLRGKSATESMSEEVDTGEYSARKSTPSSKEKQEEVFKKHHERMEKLRKEMDDEDRNKKDMSEDLDANQKRVGQLGPTEKVGSKGAVGKLVGANESVERDELAEIKRLLGK